MGCDMGGALGLMPRLNRPRFLGLNWVNRYGAKDAKFFCLIFLIGVNDREKAKP